MKILFIGTVEFSYKALEKLIQLKAEIIGVCTKERSNFNSDFADLTPLCKDNQIPYKFVDDINSKESIEWINHLSPDIIFCFGWSNLIKKELLGLAPMGILGYHPAKLPYNRGRHPIIWTLVLGLKHGASTFFFMDEGVDSGDILSQKDFDILPQDNANSVYNKVINIALWQIEEFIPQLKDGNFKRIKQNNDNTNIWRKRVKKDGQIDFRMSSEAIYNLVRGLSKPYVGAHLVYQEQEIIIWKTEIIEYSYNNIESGKVLAIDGKTITVKTYDKAIKIIEHTFKELPKVGEYL